MERVPYGGWSNCIRLAAGNAEAVVTLDVGPRIIRYGIAGGSNELVEYPHHLGQTGGIDFRSYGGHRFWIAPESEIITYEPDNDPVEFVKESECFTFKTAVGPSLLQKAIKIRALPHCSGFELDHTITNLGGNAMTVAPWCLTVMRPGGECCVPLPAHQEHPDALLPGGPIVLWRYTDLQDSRYRWGSRLIRLRQDADRGPTKFGAFVEQGWAAHRNEGVLFVKTFGANRDATYPDFGCNFESFTRQDMLEVETLGPLVTLEPRTSTSQLERWGLFENVQLPSDDEALEHCLQEFANRIENASQ